jgi:hypothetical protein
MQKREKIALVVVLVNTFCIGQSQNPIDLLSPNPQDMSYPDYPLQNKPALPRLREIHVPTLILVGDADIPDMHAHAARSKPVFPMPIASSLRESAISCI